MLLLYIKNVALKNFKCFVDQEINFNARFNLIVGNNGVGKTSILEAYRSYIFDGVFKEY